MFIAAIVVVACLAGVNSMPLHASCKLDWSFQVDCSAVKDKLVQQIGAWHSADTCGTGEKCLYTLTTQLNGSLALTHETPVHHYVDDVKFTFTAGSTAGTCNVHGYSTSETWYAVLDYSTNYCNMRNLLEGASLHTTAGFTESTSNNICTQYSSANCDKY